MAEESDGLPFHRLLSMQLCPLVTARFLKPPQTIRITADTPAGIFIESLIQQVIPTRKPESSSMHSVVEDGVHISVGFLTFDWSKKKKMLEGNSLPNNDSSNNCLFVLNANIRKKILFGKN